MTHHCAMAARKAKGTQRCTNWGIFSGSHGKFPKAWSIMSFQIQTTVLVTLIQER